MLELHKKAESTAKWIPVTHRLPKESDGPVLVCVQTAHGKALAISRYSQFTRQWRDCGGVVTHWKKEKLPGE